MLVDFGFARALEHEEIITQAKKLRNSIVFEANHKPPVSTIPKIGEISDDEEEDMELLTKLAETAALNIRATAFEPTNTLEDEVMGTGHGRRRQSGISMPLPQAPQGGPKRMSTTRHNVRSMSALGTKAYAAPEIRKKLRHKNEEDLEKANAAMTECVADYGMIVDAYSVGWTLRVVLTGVPPNFTISEYLQEREHATLEEEIEEQLPRFCCCFGGSDSKHIIVRDPSRIPHDAALLIASMTERNPENRMTVREAQNHPYIVGTGADRFSPPQGDVPSQHGDPVVPLRCSQQLSKLTIDYHLQ